MNRQELVKQIKEKRSFLCVGLDSDIKKLPACLQESDDAIFEFNKAIIDATAPYTVAYKPNLAFYEAFGVKGWMSFEKTVKYIKANYPEIFIIADAKRGDIGNTSALYARSFFEEMKVDSLTVAPYMGEDSVKPFLAYEGTWVIVLALTSNPGSHDFQLTKDEEGTMLFEKVLADGDCLTLNAMELSGKDLMAMGAPHGKVLGEVLAELLDMVLQKPEKNTKDILSEKALSILKEKGML